MQRCSTTALALCLRRRRALAQTVRRKATRDAAESHVGIALRVVAERNKVEPQRIRRQETQPALSPCSSSLVVFLSSVIHIGVAGERDQFRRVSSYHSEEKKHRMSVARVQGVSLLMI